MLTADGREGERLLDHPGMLRGTQIMLGQPYNLAIRELEELIKLCRKYRVNLTVGGWTSWYPGETFHVALLPSMETFALLKLKQPAIEELHPLDGADLDYLT